MVSILELYAKNSLLKDYITKGRQSKPNLGHSEGAAAITSVMKAALSLENRTILPNIKFNDPNPRSAWFLWGQRRKAFNNANRL
jgi:3-oxoacyl-(acyl-carrier-protein) synthase